MTSSEREKLLGLSLEEKIDYSKKITKEAIEKFGREKLIIAWTGGKDSTTMLWLYTQVCKELDMRLPHCMFIDEGDVFDEILELVNRVKTAWRVEVVTVRNNDVLSQVKNPGDMVKVKELNERNRKEITKIGFGEESFPFHPESYVGNHLMKTVAMNVFIEENDIRAVSTAIRWDEQLAREEEVYFSLRSNPDHIRVQPILHFKERDIWDTIHKYKIPFCSLYHRGYRSLGIKSNTKKFSDMPAWQQDLENTTERDGRGRGKEEIMSKLRDLGYM